MWLYSGWHRHRGSRQADPPGIDGRAGLAGQHLSLGREHSLVVIADSAPQVRVHGEAILCKGHRSGHQVRPQLAAMALVR